MSKKNGAFFSRTLFGYKRADVNEFIRQSDRSHEDNIVLLTSERDLYEERAINAETRVKELETTLERERNGAKEALKRVSAEYEKKLLASAAEADGMRNRLSVEVKKSLELIARAETAEEKLSSLSAELEAMRAEIEELKQKISEKREEAKKQAELDAYVGEYALKRDEERRSANSAKPHTKRKPLVLRLVSKK